jgi:hypothetical protein
MYRVHDWSTPCVVTEGGVYTAEVIRHTGGLAHVPTTTKMVLGANNLWKEAKNDAH